MTVRLPQDRRLRWELAILACMYAGYMGFILCRSAIFAASPAMVADPALGLSKTMFGAILGWGTAGMVAGKLLNGAVADRLGGRRVFLLALLITAASACALGAASRFAAFAALNFTMLFAAAAGWPAMAQLISAWYPPQEYGRVWGVVSTSSRLSSVLSALFLGALLARLAWPSLFWAAGALTAAAAAVLCVFLKGRPADVGLAAPAASGARPPDSAGLGAALRGFAASGRFWLICVSIMCTTVLMEVIGFLPLYLKENFGVSASAAATAAAVFPAGCFAALLLGGFVYDRVTRRGRVFLLGGMLLLSCASLAALLALTRLPTGSPASFAAAVAILFVYGLSVAPAYYLPMSVFSVEFGGRHCGVLIGIIDAVGYGAAMLYQFLGGAIVDQPGGWDRMLVLLLAVAAAATASTAWFAYQDSAAQARAGR
ncbi:MAG: MFS transporter [Elusimicrobia bacterium]|nr:MFS transporter [Elusimicrobiota bacterium]